MNQQTELAELIQQAKEHLRYYESLGVTHLGEAETLTSAAAPMDLVVTPARTTPAVEAAPVALAEVLPKIPLAAPEPPPAAVNVQNKTTIEKPLGLVSPPVPTAIIMPMAKKAPEAVIPSLFGEVAPPPPASVLPVLANETLEDIRLDLGDCERCKLYKTRTNIVFGEGIPTADLMFVGEAPGADEDATGRPFVGRAGQLLTKMIEAIDLKRDQVYIANVLKSRPPNNRNPEKDEVEACKPFLWRQIAVIKPKLIVTLGNPATQLLLETKIGITRLRGEFQEYARIPGIKVIPTFHPAYLLRSPDKKREAWEDLKKVRAFLRGEIKP